MMDRLPVLETERLTLRQFEFYDRVAVMNILNDSQVTATLLDIPEPFHFDDADMWIRAGHAGIALDHLYPFAIVRRDDNALLGCVDLEKDSEHRRADMAYWIGSIHWRKGYTSEAAACILRFGFETLDLNRIYAQCLVHNVASAGVMKKIGLKYEATLRQAMVKNGQFIDMAVYGLCRADYNQAS
jgi:RimJ/RimL family protein N-acetyltransferase